MTLEPKTPYRRRMKIPHLLLLGVVTYPLADMLVAGPAPDVVGHLEADDEDPLGEFVCTTAEGVCACHLVDVGFAIVVGGVVFVEGLHLDETVCGRKTAMTEVGILIETGPDGSTTTHPLP
jgi:hypothetical protein